MNGLVIEIVVVVVIHVFPIGTIIWIIPIVFIVRRTRACLIILDVMIAE